MIQSERDAMSDLLPEMEPELFAYDLWTGDANPHAVKHLYAPKELASLVGDMLAGAGVIMWDGGAMTPAHLIRHIAFVGEAENAEE